jgi:Peptidase C13 family
MSFAVALIQTLFNGLELLRFRRPETRLAHLDATVIVLTVLTLMLAEGVLSFLMNGSPGHIEWLALPDLTFPVLLLIFSCWAAAVTLNQKGLLFELFHDVLSARLITVLILVVVQGLQRKGLGALTGVGLTDWIQQCMELWWLLAVMVRLGFYADTQLKTPKYQTVWVWIAFVGPWLFWLSLFQAADLWQADGVESDPKRYAQAMTEDTFTLQSQMFEGMLDNFEPERPNEEDIYFLGVSGEAGNPLYLNEAERALEAMRDVYGTDGRAGILANNASNNARYPFATHSNIEATLNHIAELIDVEDDILFLFLSSRGTQSPSLVLSQPGLILADIDPKGLKKALDDAQIKWRIIVISACYSGGFIPSLADSKTLIITSSDGTDKGLGCAPNKNETWFSKIFFEEGLKKSLGITTAFHATYEILKKQQGADQYSGLPQMALGEEMKHKLAVLESRVLQPGALKDGIRAHWKPSHPVEQGYAGISGVREHSKAWMVSFNKSLRFLSRTKANSSISAATM